MSRWLLLSCLLLSGTLLGFVSPTLCAVCCPGVSAEVVQNPNIVLLVSGVIFGCGMLLFKGAEGPYEGVSFFGGSLMLILQRVSICSNPSPSTLKLDRCCRELLPA